MSISQAIKATGAKFSYRLQNAAGASKNICLFPAHFPTLKVVSTGATAEATVTYNNPAAVVAAGYSCDAVLDDGTIATSVTATALTSDKKIREFIPEMKSAPRVIKDIIIQANNEDVFNKALKVASRTSLGGSVMNDVLLSIYKSVDQQSDTKIHIKDINIELAHDTLMFLEVDDSRTVDITYIFE